MANEISWSNLETDAGLAHYLAGQVEALLYDPTDLRAVCRRRDFMSGMGSETIKVTQYSRAHTFAAATSELVGGASNADIGSANFQLTVSRRLIKWQASDLWRIVAPTGSIDMDLLAGVISEAAGLTVTDMLCALFPSLSNSVGSTTAQMDFQTLLDAQYQLNDSRVPAPYSLVLAPHGFNKLQDDLVGQGGAIQWLPATAEMVAAKGPGFKGTLQGVDVWDSDSVTEDGGNTYHRAAMFGLGCFEFTEAPAFAVDDALPANVTRVLDGTVRLVHSYDADNGLTSVIGNYYPAVAEAEDARGVLINSLSS